MSIVVWDGKTLAADKQATIDDRKVKCTKIMRLPTGELLAWVGNHESGLTLAQWYAAGAKEEDWPKFQEKEAWTNLIVIHKGKAWEYEQLPIRQRVETLPAAWGSGTAYALGAMAMGADAVKAVRVASKFCTTCGLGVDSFKAS